MLRQLPIDIEVASGYYLWLCRCLALAKKTPYSVFGASLQAPVDLSTGQLVPETTHDDLILTVNPGSWGFMALPEPWTRFLKWYHAHQGKNAIPEVDSLRQMPWYGRVMNNNGFDHWTLWAVAFAEYDLSYTVAGVGYQLSAPFGKGSLGDPFSALHMPLAQSSQPEPLSFEAVSSLMFQLPSSPVDWSGALIEHCTPQLDRCPSAAKCVNRFVDSACVCDADDLSCLGHLTKVFHYAHLQFSRDIHDVGLGGDNWGNPKVA